MAEKIRIERLEPSDKIEASKVLAQAFSGLRSPMPATQPRIKRVLVSTLRRVLGQDIGMRAKLVLSGGFKNLLTYGIRKDEGSSALLFYQMPKKYPKNYPYYQE
jgi:predicted ATPase with chaperone activity